MPPFSQFSNKDPDEEREVLRNDGSPNPTLQVGQVIWEWKDDKRFKEHTPNVSLLIERGFNNKRKKLMILGENGKVYSVNLSDPKHLYQENIVTHYKRIIRRRPN